MRRDRRNKAIIMFLLVFAVFGLAIGFSAFTATLTIESGLSVNPTSGTFSVRFSSSGTAIRNDSIIATVSSPIINMQDAVISSENPTTITNLRGTFTEPGQTATYTFYATNNGGYDAYLSTITYLNATGASSNKLCIPGEGTSAASVESACNSISVKVTVGSELPVTGTTTLTDHLLSVGSFETITVTLEYAVGGSEANGPFTISFGNIQLLYEQVEPVIPPTPSSEYICSPVISSSLGSVPTGSYIAGDEYTCQVSDSNSFNFFVINSTADSVTLIMADTGLSETATWNDTTLIASGPVSAYNYLNATTGSWTNLSNIDATYANDGALSTDVTNLTTMFSQMGCTLDLTTIYGGIATTGDTTNIYNYSNVSTAIYTNLKARLPYVSELLTLGCGMQTDTCPSYIDTTVGYWLSTPFPNTNSGCVVEADGSNAALYLTTSNTISGDYVGNSYNIRPVITVAKTDIES